MLPVLWIGGPPGDPGRHRLQARNLAAIVPVYEAAGARCVIAAGVVGLVRAHLAPTGSLAGAPTEAPTEAPTGALTGAPAGTSARPASGPVLWLCGATAVGRSSVGWEIMTRRVRAGARTAFVDLEQLGFLGPGPVDHRLQAANAAAVWRVFRDGGAESLVAVGAVNRDEVDQYRALLDVTLVRRHASPATLAGRVRRRGDGEGVQLAGERLSGVDRTALTRISVEAADEARRLAERNIGDACVDTDGRTVDQMAQDVVGALPR